MGCGCRCMSTVCCRHANAPAVCSDFCRALIPAPFSNGWQFMLWSCRTWRLCHVSTPQQAPLLAAAWTWSPASASCQTLSLSLAPRYLGSPITAQLPSPTWTRRQAAVLQDATTTAFLATWGSDIAPAAMCNHSDSRNLTWGSSLRAAGARETTECTAAWRTCTGVQCLTLVCTLTGV